MTGSVGPQWVSLGGQLLPGVIEIVHVSTTADRLFLNRDLLKNLNFMVGTVLMFLISLIKNGTLSLILDILLAENVQIVHCPFLEHLRVDDPLARSLPSRAIQPDDILRHRRSTAEATCQAAISPSLLRFRPDDDRHDRLDCAFAAGARAVTAPLPAKADVALASRTVRPGRTS
jgi:hypothetical protein